MHAISSYRGNRHHPPATDPPPHTHTNLITVHCAAMLSAQCKKTKIGEGSSSLYSRTHACILVIWENSYLRVRHLHVYWCGNELRVLVPNWRTCTALAIAILGAAGTTVRLSPEAEKLKRREQEHR